MNIRHDLTSENISSLYATGMSASEISLELECNIGTIIKRLKNLNLYNGRRITKEFKRKMSKIQKGELNSNWKGEKKEYTCELCGNVKKSYDNGIRKFRFCSNKCSSKVLENPFNKNGKEHPKWKDDKISPFRKALRQSHLYKKWREEVFFRDDYTCQQCGKRGCELEAHHLSRYAEILNNNDIQTFDAAEKCEELWNIENGITYCVKCHAENDVLRNIGGEKMKVLININNRRGGD